MSPQIEKLHSDLEKQLAFITHEKETTLRKAELSVSVCQKALDALKTLALSKKFKNQDEEILFFKTVKPRFSSKLIFNFLLFNLEKSKPQVNTKAQLQHYEKALLDIEEFYKQNVDLCTYYRTEGSYFDPLYFVRDQGTIHLVKDEVFFASDRSFNTTHDLLFAKIIANDLLVTYITSEIAKLEGPGNSLLAKANGSDITWTESKASLILLVYALHSAGCFNRGTVGLKELADTFSKVFNIDLGDFYRTWSELKLRKDPTKFLETLKMELENRIMVDMQ